MFVFVHQIGLNRLFNAECAANSLIYRKNI